jgi:polyhydroxybutyrate depolymerase
MIAFHGTDDRIAPYRGGSSWVAPNPFADIPKWAANWARRNRCAPDPVESVVAIDVNRLEYTDCADDAAVVLYTVIGGGHTWPGGTPLPEWPRATASMPRVKCGLSFVSIRFSHEAALRTVVAYVR